MKTIPQALVWGLSLVLMGCSAPYYSAMEKLGIAKRDILVDRVQDTRDAQDRAKEQISTALERFLAFTRYEGGDLQRKYDQLNSEFTRAESRAREVRDRIVAVEDVAEALFDEWRQELRQYTDAGLRRESEREFDRTRSRYTELIRTMKRSAERMDPVLGRFRDHVLYLKHNLNAQALGSLSRTQREIEEDVSGLVKEMEASIRDAEEFIRAMKSGGSQGRVE